MKKVMRWLSPLILGVVMFNFIRLVTDLPRNDDFWAHSKMQHLQALGVSIFFCYVLDYRIRITIAKKLSQPKPFILGIAYPHHYYSLQRGSPAVSVPANVLSRKLKSPVVGEVNKAEAAPL